MVNGSDNFSSPAPVPHVIPRPLLPIQKTSVRLILNQFRNIFFGDWLADWRARNDSASSQVALLWPAVRAEPSLNTRFRPLFMPYYSRR